LFIVMKLSLATFNLLALVASVSAQYFSAGWTPGQKQPAPQTFDTKPAPIPEATKAANPFSLSKLYNSFSAEKLLTSWPSIALFDRFGINITERVETSLLAKIWDERIPLITDNNYNDLVVNEVLTEQEEKDRVWMIVISVTSARADGVSKFLDGVFDTAFNESLIAGDLPHVKWGRIDYLNVTAITTKWVIWQAPYLVVLKDRGKTLRFYRPHHLRLREDALREFLKADGWQVTPPWSSPYAPGGPREYILDFFAIWLTKIYNVTMLVPRWMFVFASGTLASLIIGALHKPSKAKPAAVAQMQPADRESTAPAAPQAKRTGNVKQRKTKS